MLSSGLHSPRPPRVSQTVSHATSVGHLTGPQSCKPSPTTPCRRSPTLSHAPVAQRPWHVPHTQPRAPPSLLFQISPYAPSLGDQHPPARPPVMVRNAVPAGRIKIRWVIGSRLGQDIAPGRVAVAACPAVRRWEAIGRKPLIGSSRHVWRSSCLSPAPGASQSRSTHARRTPGARPAHARHTPGTRVCLSIC
jgi:hypothetical protein